MLLCNGWRFRCIQFIYLQMNCITDNLRPLFFEVSVCTSLYFLGLDEIFYKMFLQNIARGRSPFVVDR
jgi:hypothetical protein